jgi:uncharacterized protein involved in exopolysaccharide biosynthesis
MAQSNTNRRVFSPEFDGLELLLGQRSPAVRIETRPSAADYSPSDDELLGYIKRSLAGEPFPVSAPRLRSASEEAGPLASRIREILRVEQANDSIAAAAVALPAPVVAEPAPAIHEASVADPHIALPPLEMDLPPLAPASGLSRPVVGWGSAAFVVLMAVGGGCIPGILAAPPRYSAEAQLQLQGPARSTPGFIEATTLRATSSRLLSQVVTKLKLDHDAEFSGGKATAYSVVMDLLTDSGGASDNFSRAEAALRRSLTVQPDPRAGTVALAVQSADPNKSARIANFLADVAVRDAAARPFARPPNEAEAALDGTRKRYDEANAALAAFKASAGDDKIAAAADLMEKKGVLENQITEANNAAQAASIRLSAAKAVKMVDVLDGSISPDLGSPAPLEDLRNRYAAARSTLAQLATELGPRHPRLLAAQSTIDTLSGAILTEIQKMVTASDADVRTAAGQLKQLKDRLTELDRQPVDVDLAAFEKLQTDVETARRAYESATTAAEEARPAAAVASVPLALATPAAPPVAPLDDDFLGRALIGALSGFAIAMAVVGARRLFGMWFRNAPHKGSVVDFDMVDLLADIPQLVEQGNAPLDTPQQRFNAAIAAANGRPANAPASASAQPDAALTAIIGDVASLRAKVATYVSQRQAAAS